MNDKELLEYMRKIDKNFNSHVERGTIEMSLEYYNLCEELMARGINAIQENQELKKQLENCYCNRTDCSSRIRNSKQYDSLVQKTEKQQKKFIDWLENEIENCKYGEENYADGDDMSYYNENELRKEILSKYKEIIGSDK